MKIMKKIIILIFYKTLRTRLRLYAVKKKSFEQLIIARNCFQNDKNAKIRILFDVKKFLKI